MTDIFESNGEYFDEDKWRRTTEHIYDGYDADGYDADGFDSEGNDREGKDKLGNEGISDESRKLLEASYKPSSCLNCREDLPELWREIRDDYCPDCLRKGLTVDQTILDIYG